MENEKQQITDERLDQLLMQVEVPEGLHADLLGLADAQEERSNDLVSPASLSDSSQPGWAARFPVSSIVVAACYLLLTAGVIVFWPADDPVTAKKESQDPSLNLDAKSKNQNSPNIPTMQLAEMEKQIRDTSIDREATLDSIEQKLDQIRIQELEAKLARLESTRLKLESDESLSLVLAIADQTPLNFGGSKELVDKDMKFILDNFPSSQGARIAAQVADSGN